MIPFSPRQLPSEAILDFYNKAYLGQYFKTVITSTIAATTETPVLTIACPAQTAPAVGVPQSLFIDLLSLGVLTAASGCTLKAYLNPTITAAGSVVTSANVRPASATTALAVVHSGPTVSADGVLIESLVAGSQVQSTSQGLIILDPGQSLLITLQMVANPTTAILSVGHYEL